MSKTSVSILIFLLVFTGVASAFEFSADTIMRSQEVETRGKIYYKTDRFRMDIKEPEEMITIARIDKKEVWNIIPKEKIYMVIPFNMQNRPRVDEKLEGEIERKHLGNEVIDKHPVKKYLVTYKADNKKEQLYQWVATDIDFPVKSAAVDGSWVQEYRNINKGKQPDSLFEIPKGYKKFQMPGGMPGK